MQTHKNPVLTKNELKAIRGGEHNRGFILVVEANGSSREVDCRAAKGILTALTANGQKIHFAGIPDVPQRCHPNG